MTEGWIQLFEPLLLCLPRVASWIQLRDPLLYYVVLIRLLKASGMSEQAFILDPPARGSGVGTYVGSLPLHLSACGRELDSAMLTSPSPPAMAVGRIQVH